MLSLFAATPTLTLAPNAAAAALRTAAPMMQIAPPQGAGMATAGMQGRAVPTGLGVDDAILVQGGPPHLVVRSPSAEQVQVMLSTEGRPSTPT